MQGLREQSAVSNGGGNLLRAIERDDLARVAKSLLATPNLAKQPEPLILAAELGRLEAARLLLDAGADPNLSDRPTCGERPLAKLCQVSERGKWPSPHRALADLLLTRGAQPDLTAREGEQTPLMIAARAGNAEAVTFLISAADREPDLWESAAMGDVESVRAALSETPGWARRLRQGGSGPFLTHWSLLSLTASSRLGLHDAQLAQTLAEQATLLIEAGSELGERDYEGRCVPSPVADAAAAGNAAVLEALLAAGADPNLALLPALEGNDPEVLARLAERELDLNQVANPKTGASLLHQLVLWGRFPAASWLLERGAAVSPRDDDGLTPLHYAVRRGCEPADLEPFLKAGADLEARDRRERTPLDLAREKGRSQLYELLGE